MKKQASRIICSALLLMISFSMYFAVPISIFKPTDNSSSNNNLINVELVGDEIIQDSQSSQENYAHYYGNHLSFEPYGVYVLMPSYIQRYVNNTESNKVYFELVDKIGNEEKFNFYKVYINNTLFHNATTSYLDDKIEIDLGNHLEQPSVSNLTISARHQYLDEWVNKTSILNVTSNLICMAPYYDNFNLEQSTTGYFQWEVNVPSGNRYNWKFFIDNVSYQSESSVYNSELSVGLPQYNSIGTIKQFRLEIWDDFGHKNINKFNATIVSKNGPSIIKFTHNFYFQSNNQSYESSSNSAKMWEEKDMYITVKGYDLDNNIDRIELFEKDSNPVLPFYVISDVSNNEEFKIPLNHIMLDKFVSESNENDYWDSKYSLNFKARIIDQSGRFNDVPGGNALGFYMKHLNNKSESLTIKKNYRVFSGRNVDNLNITDESHKELSYKLTVVMDVEQSMNISIRALTAEVWSHDSGGDYCRSGQYQQGQDCSVFKEKDYDHDYIAGGIVFWINAENSSAVKLPMTIKILYPSWLNTETEFGDPPLRLLHYEANKTTSSYKWGYGNASSIKSVGENSIETTINSLGFYGFGMDGADYNDYSEGGDEIPGYPLEIILSLIGVSLAIILHKKRAMKRI
jgi:hypothetical protein